MTTIFDRAGYTPVIEGQRGAYVGRLLSLHTGRRGPGGFVRGSSKAAVLLGLRRMLLEADHTSLEAERLRNFRDQGGASAVPCRLHGGNCGYVFQEVK